MFHSLLRRIAAALDAASLPYMVIGGQAVLVHGEPRLTRDIDITLGVDSKSLQVLLGIVESLGLSLVTTDIDRFVQETNVVPAKDQASGIRVDFIFSFTPYEAGAIRRAVGLTMEGTEVRFASAEDLIIHKMVAGRPRDDEDVRGILARKLPLDEQYLSHWLHAFHEVTGRNLLDEFRAMRPV